MVAFRKVASSAKKLLEVAFVVEAFVAKRFVLVELTPEKLPSERLVPVALRHVRSRMKALEVVALVVEAKVAKRFVVVAFVKILLTPK